MDTPASTYYNPSGAGFSSDRMDWRTPPDLFRALDDEFHFTLDAAANEANHLCDRYYTATDSAFSHSWAGERVFCNPPYGRDAAKWIEKCAREGGGALVAALLPARTDTRAFHRFIYKQPNVEIRFLPGRLHFGHPETGEPGEAAPFPSMIVIWKP